MDQDEHFKKTRYSKGTKQRWNFNNLLPINEGAILCQNGNQTIGYSMKEVCSYKSFNDLCHLSDGDTNISIEIDQW